MSLSRFQTYPHPPPKESWRGKPLNERKGWVKNCFVLTKSLNTLLDDVCERVMHIDSEKVSCGVLVLGGSGAGKSKLVEVLHAAVHRHYWRDDPEKTVMPVLSLRIPERCTPFELHSSILKKLETLPSSAKRAAEAKERAHEGLVTTETRLILVDDFQDIPLRRSTRGIDQVGGSIRDLMDSKPAVWVFFGTKESMVVRSSMSQLIKRIKYIHRLDYFDINNDTSVKRFIRVLVDLDKWLPLAEPSCFIEKEFPGLMFLATSGIFDYLISLLDQCVKIAWESGRESIQREDLIKGFLKLHGQIPAGSNPFEPGFIPHTLNRQWEPFEAHCE